MPLRISSRLDRPAGILLSWQAVRLEARQYVTRTVASTLYAMGVASELIENGAPLTVVQSQMRHSDARITSGRYGHVVGDSQRNAVAVLAQKIAKPELLTSIVDINNSLTVTVN